MNSSSALLTASILAIPTAALGQDFGPQQIITNSATWVRTIHADDIDGDGKIDILGGQDGGKVAWYKNLGGGVFQAPFTITTFGNGMESIYTADFDGDGDPDVLTASRFLSSEKIAWYENWGGGHFGGPEQVISTATDGLEGIYATDLDGDGDVDVLSASSIDDRVAWYENLGGGVFGPQVVISNAANGANSVFAADLDRDGDVDVLSALRSDHTVAWYENLGGGAFGLQQIISDVAYQAESVFTADFDGDGDEDVLSTGVGPGNTAWYENLGGGVFGPQRAISTTLDSSKDAYATDLDGDGDVDVATVSNTPGSRVSWFENLGGGTFGPQQAINDEVYFPVRVYAADLDGDGDAEVLSASVWDTKLAWYENLIGVDCNSNGIADAVEIAGDLTLDIDGDEQLDECVAPALVADTYELSVATGGTQTFSLQAPATVTSPSFYILLGSLSGTTPGVPVGPYVVPLNADSYLARTFITPNSLYLANSMGVMTPAPGGGGKATASLTLPPGLSPALVGKTVHHSFVYVETQTGTVNFVSNAVPLALLP